MKNLKTPKCIECGSHKVRFDPDFGFYKCESCSTVWALDESATANALIPPCVAASYRLRHCLESERGYWPSGDSQASTLGILENHLKGTE